MSVWLMFEVFDPSRNEPTMIAAGTSPRRQVPMRNVLRGRSLGDAEAAIASLRTTGAPLDVTVPA